jgi:hypothetical protein
MEAQQMSYMWFTRNDIMLTLLLIGLAIYICTLLVQYIIAKKTNTTVRPITYITSLINR